jgi:hypothetical protein
MNDEKARRLKALMDEVMAELVDEVVDEKTLDLLDKNLRKEISRAGLKYNAASVKLFLAAFELAITAFGSMGPQGAMPLLLGLRKISGQLSPTGKQVDLTSVEDALKRSKEQGGDDAK